MTSTQFTRVAPYILSLLRIVAAVVFMTHGSQKLFGVPGAGLGTHVPWFSQFGLAGVLELGGGALMLLGMWARPVAFVLSGEMAWAYFQAHAPRSIWPSMNGGEPAVLYCFIWLYITAAGPGPLSVDARR
jgi:putative oxidoreductase